MTKEIITLMSLDDAAQAGIIKTKLETEGITCFMDRNLKSAASKKEKSSKQIDLRVYMQDLDKALKLVGEDAAEET